MQNAVEALSKHIFNGAWITDREFAALRPRNVFFREMDRLSLDCGEHRNRHILFRRKFILKEKPQKAVIYVTADDYFKLFLNGRFVCQGPSPAYPQRMGYLAVDVADFLTKGENTLSAHTYYQGLINRVWVSGDRRHGFLCDLEADGKVVVCSDESFLTHPHTGYSEIGVTGYDTQFLEDYDSAAPEVGFERPDFDDAYWEHASRREYTDYTLFPQATKPLAFESISPAEVSSQKLDDGKTSLLIDFGKCFVGYLFLRGKGGAGQRVIIRCAQEMEKDENHIRYEMRCNCRYEEGWLLSGKEDELDWFDYKSFRYAQLILPEGCEITEIALIARHYPFSLQAGLKPSYRGDSELEKIWELCVHTQKYGAQEILQDCMEREKGFYVGDGCYTSLTYLLLTGDDSLMRKLIDDAFFSGFITPGTMICLDCSFMQEIAEFPLILVSLVLWHYRVTGDQEYLRQNYRGVKSVLDAYTRDYLHNGLLSKLDKWCVVEWPDNFRDGYDVDLTSGKICEEAHVVINAYYLQAIRCVNEMARILKEPSYREEQPLIQAFYKAFYDPKRGYFRDSKSSGHVSYIGNLFPFAFGLIPDGGFEKNMMELISQKGIENLSLFGTFPLLAALTDRGENELVRKLLSSPGAWLRMLSEGATTTYESWGKETKWNTSLFHMTFSYAAVFLTDTGGFRFYESLSDGKRNVDESSLPV